MSCLRFHGCSLHSKKEALLAQGPSIVAELPFDQCAILHPDTQKKHPESSPLQYRSPIKDHLPVGAHSREILGRIV